MPSPGCRIAVLLASLAIVVALLSDGAATAQPAQPTHQDLLKQFNSILAAKQNAGRPPVGVVMPGPKRGVKASEGMIQIWTEKIVYLNPMQWKLTGDVFAPGDYVWSPKDTFVFSFLTTDEVRFQMYNLSKGPGGAVKREMALPAADYPLSLEPIKPGKPYRLEVAMEMFDNKEPEEVEFIFISPNAPNQPLPLPAPRPGAPAGGGVLLKPKVEEWQKWAEKMQGQTGQLHGQEVPPAAPSAKEQDRDQVASVLGMSDKVASVKFTMRKKQ
jgi:hypothetical protein